MYVPLRVHGHHSFLTGVDAPAVLLARAGELGLPALALADVDTTAGLVDYLRAAERLAARAPERRVRPIVAAEISDPSGEPGRLIALVESERGYHNLLKLVSARHLGADPGERGAELAGPARFALAANAVRFQEGLIFLADHPRLLIALFGRVDPRNLFAALSPAALRTRRGTQLARVEHTLEEPKVPPPQAAASAEELLEAARAVGAAALAVPDVYCARAEGARDHRVRVAIKHNALLADLPPQWLAAEPAHLLGAEDMHALYRDVADVPGPFRRSRTGRGKSSHPSALVARTLAVAERCAFTPALGLVHFPAIELGPDESAYSRLCQLAFDGARSRYRPLRPEVVRRLDRELAAIESLGFAPYFLLVKRIADFARQERIPCVGRGSAADSLVAYCLALTDADPLRYRLPFERFLNPARKDRPDIDLDFCWRRRDEVLAHVYQAFGPERTAMISTLNTFGLRSAFRETALAAGIPPAEVNPWSRRLPWDAPMSNVARAKLAAEFSGPSAIARAIASTPECRNFPADDPRWRRVIAAAERAIDAPRHLGLHPGGVVVAPGAITDFVACQRATKGVVVTQLDKDAVEAVGLVKMDLLGNRALTVIDDCVHALAARGIAVDPAAIPEDDPATAELLVHGRTLGCSQVESPGMRNLLIQIGARDMDAAIQAVALIRPGPAGSGMKDAFVRRARGLEPPNAPHPSLDPVLAETYGVMLYQEDVMRVAAELAGLTLAEADSLRRALQKRREQELAPLARRFVEGALARGVDRASAERTWELASNFASFAFCKAHAVTYGRIGYRTVYLKAHYPAAYLAAFLQSETGYYEPRVYVEEARRLGVAILGPDVNASGATFAIEWIDETPCLRVGLAQVKGLSERTLSAILEQRAAHGPFLSLPDFLERTRAATDEAEALVQCGALDSFDRTRPEMLWRLELLRNGRTRVPPGEKLDPAQLAACRASPRTRAVDAIARARAHAGGWRGATLGLARAELARGETAALFPTPETPALALPALPDLDLRTRGMLEYELLGLTVGAHPTAIFPCAAEARMEAAGEKPPNPKPCAELARWDRARISLRGWLAASRRVRTENGEWMRFLTLEDESGVAETIVFPDVYRRDGHALVDRGPHWVTGVVEDHYGAHALRAERIW